MKALRMKILISSLVLAFVLWAVMFVLRPFNFWLMMAMSTLTLTLIAFASDSVAHFFRPLKRTDVLWGILSAFALYGLFFLGNQVLILLSEWLPQFFGQRQENLAAVYANRGSLPHWLVALLLFFPIGFGEEVYWRGFVQKHLANRLGGFGGFLLTVLFYTAVHLVTANIVLFLAAFVCGLYWGFLYWKTQNLWIVLISHMIWDPFIFILFPIR